MIETVMSPQELAQAMAEFSRRHREALGLGTKALKPDHLQPWHWPPHSVGMDYHVDPNRYEPSEPLRVLDRVYRLERQETPYGTFGRLPEIWAEARGDNDDTMRAALQRQVRPLIRRQAEIARTLEVPPHPWSPPHDGPRLYEGSIRDLSDLDKLKLFYCWNRSIAQEARLEIEVAGHRPTFYPALVQILRDTEHPHRRIAHWLVLDMLEELPLFCREAEGQQLAIDAIHDLMVEAEDDYARAIFKAGVVLGGHIMTEPAAAVLFKLTEAPSKIARRSAIHAVFHLAEWLPERKEEIIATLERCAANDPEPLLREFASAMARDVRAENLDHMTEPTFPDEP